MLLPANDPAPVSAPGARIGASVRGVADLDRSAAFYRDGLGMVTTPRRVPGGLRLRLAGPSGACLELRRVAGADGHGGGHVAIGVPDLSAAFSRIAAFASQVTRAPGRMVMGGPLCAFVRDPDGHVVELVQTRRTPNDPVTAFAHPGALLGPDDGRSRLLHTSLPVSDMAVALRFYAEGLGMAEIERVQVPVMGGVTAVFVAGGSDRAGYQLELACFAAGPAPPPADSCYLTVVVPDPVAAAAGLVALGFAPPVESGIGLLVRDADGNRLLLQTD